MKKVYIYVLICPIYCLPRYIGKTQNPETRLAAHISKAKGGHTNHHCARWIRQIISAGLRPRLEIIFEVPNGECWQEHEKRIIAEYKSAGLPLTNLTGGGEGFYKPNADLLRRRGIAKSESFKKPGVMEKFKASVKLGNSRPETRIAHSNATKKVWQDPIRRAAMIASMNTPEARQRRAEATRRRYQDERFRQRHSERQKAPERLAQLRQASIKRWSDYRARKSTAGPL